MRLPSSWEMIRYGLRYRAGTCVYADPYTDRFHLAWERETHPPPIDRVLSDMRAYERKAVPGDNPEGLHFTPLPSHGAWQGWVVRGPGIHKARAVRWWPEFRVLLEATFPVLEQGQDAAELLNGITVRPPAPISSWQCFGLRVEVASSFSLAQCRCLPGDVELHFQDSSRRALVRVRRMAFPSVWLRRPLTEWLRGQRPRPWHIEHLRPELGRKGHEMAVMVLRRGLLWRLVPGARDWRRVEVACVCEAEKHAYHGVAEFSAAVRDRVRVRARCPCGDWFDADRHVALAEGGQGV